MMMKIALALSLAALLAPVHSLPIKRAVDPALVPDLGFQAGLNPTGTGDCDGAVNGADGKPIKIPCACPPDRATFIKALDANVAAGKAVNNPTVKVTFPTDNSTQSQLDRITAASITLQNLNGPGKGCPIVSTTLSAQAKAIDQGTASPPPVTPPVATSPAPKPAAPAPVPSPPAPAAGGVDPALVPDLGFKSGLNPTGTGDCDGAVNGADGKPIKIPCACPPDRATFIKALNANVAAGKAVNNPTVKVTFPTDSSKQSQLDRITAAAITLQNLNGPGKGCPVVSTTLSAQAKAIEQGTAPPPPAAPPATSSPTPPAPKPAPPASSAPAAPAPNNAATNPSNGVDPALVPDLGFKSGVNPTGTGDCDGAVNGADGKPIKIPCACPPDRDTFIKALSANVAAGKAVNNPTVKVTFPTDNSKQSQLDRITAASITLQNLNGPGKGCPIVSTTLSAQAKAIEQGTAPPPPAAPAATSSPTPPAPKPASPAPASPAPNNAATNPSSGVDPALVPDLGFKSGLNPTGTGDCDGAVNGADGKPIKIPCACPPDRDTFIKALSANVAAGKAVNNPTVKVTFPTDNSKQSQLDRITAASITLQNLNGPGKGCPIVSTTLSAQAKAIEQGTAPPPPATPPATSAPAPTAPKPAPAAPSNAASNPGGVDPALVPDLGFKAGLNPTGTGDCDGAVNGADGKPIKIPCACPPDRATFIKALSANVAAGKAVNNPSVPVTFPTDNSQRSQLDRIQAALVTLQNLNGPGKGCPAVSTTLLAQQRQIAGN